MDLNKLKYQLQGAVPAELYKIEPGQIVLFTPNDGVDANMSYPISKFLMFLNELDKDANARLNFIATDNQLLIGTLAGRNRLEIGIPYNVFIGTWDNITGIAALLLNKSVDEVCDSPISASVKRGFDFSATSELPIIISLDPRENPVVVDSIMGEPEGFGGLEALTHKPEPGSKAEAKFIQKAEADIEKVLRNCALFDIDLDLNKIKDRISSTMNNDVDYHLSFNVKVDRERPLRQGFSVFDIYVADGEEYKLDLTAWHKAVYLTFLLYEDGIKILDTYTDFRETSRKIYLKLPIDKNKCNKDDGDMDARLFEGYISTMRTYLNAIRDEVSSKVANPKTAIEFAIEGYSGKPYRIVRSTPEIRAQIKEWFRL